ncbi:MAG: PD-(D/E)XK nuclease domain-containing protein, partial [Bacteroidia bacterium]|nr:PD-(D/E)XK nuclease domain-containing protein [Bacteroidia bacterium]
KRDFINFLAYLGNLTIECQVIGTVVQFKIPNKVIEELYWRYYEEVLKNISGLNYDITAIESLIVEMALDGNCGRFFAFIETVFKQLSNRDFIQFSEKQIKMILIAYLSVVNVFEVVSEREVKEGYIDLMLLQRPNNQLHHEYLIEIKYLKKDEMDLLPEKQVEANNQLLKYYHSNPALKSKEELHLISVVASKDRIEWQEIDKTY